jgi:hypothetical protein
MRPNELKGLLKDNEEVPARAKRLAAGIKHSWNSGRGFGWKAQSRRERQYRS